MLYHLLVLPLIAAAEIKPKSAFEEALEQNLQVPTEERTVTIAGVEYREVRYEGKRYYIRFLERAAEAEVDCGLDSWNLPSQAKLAIKATKRSHIFVKLLRETCEPATRGNFKGKRVIKIDARYGFTIPDDADSKIKNKEVFLNRKGIGLSGEW